MIARQGFPPRLRNNASFHCGMFPDCPAMISSRKTSIRLLIASILALTLPHPGHAGLLDERRDGNSNLLQNGDFSKGIEGWKFNAHLKQGKAEADSSVSHDGKPSVRIENFTADDSQLSQVVQVKPGKLYRLAGWIKTDKVTPGRANPKSTAGASLAIREGFLKSAAINKTQDWKHVTVDIAAMDKNDIDIGPRLGAFGGTVTGTAWFADLTLKEVGPARK